jgi:hypothetical protein
MTNRSSVEELQTLLHSDAALFVQALAFGVDTLRSREQLIRHG